MSIDRYYPLSADSSNTNMRSSASSKISKMRCQIWMLLFTCYLIKCAGAVRARKWVGSESVLQVDWCCVSFIKPVEAFYELQRGSRGLLLICSQTRCSFDGCYDLVPPTGTQHLWEWMEQWVGLDAELLHDDWRINLMAGCLFWHDWLILSHALTEERFSVQSSLVQSVCRSERPRQTVAHLLVIYTWVYTLFAKYSEFVHL